MGVLTSLLAVVGIHIVHDTDEPQTQSAFGYQDDWDDSSSDPQLLNHATGLSMVNGAGSFDLSGNIWGHGGDDGLGDCGGCFDSDCTGGFGGIDDF